MNIRTCEKVSAVAREMTEKPRKLGYNRTLKLLSSIPDTNKVDWIRHLGNRIVGYNGGHRFVLS